MTHRLILRRVTHGLWTQLPTWLSASVAICAAAAISVVLAPGITPVSIPVTVLLLTAPTMGLLAAVDQVVLTDDTSISFWWRAIRRLTGFGFSVLVWPTAAVSLMLVALTVWRRTGTAVALVPLIVGGIVSAVTLLATTAVLPLGIARPSLRGTRLWLTGMHLVARWPIRFLAAPSLLALGVWLATSVSASLLLLAPAPAALVLGAAFWTSAVDLGATDLEAEVQVSIRT